MYYEIMHFNIKKDYSVCDLKTAINTVYDQFWLKQTGFLKSFLIEINERTFTHIILWENENLLKLCQEKMINYRNKFLFFNIVEPDTVEQYLGSEIMKWHKTKNK